MYTCVRDVKVDNNVTSLIRYHIARNSF